MDRLDKISMALALFGSGLTITQFVDFTTHLSPVLPLWIVPIAGISCFVSGCISVGRLNFLPATVILGTFTLLSSPLVAYNSWIFLASSIIFTIFASLEAIRRSGRINI